MKRSKETESKKGLNHINDPSSKTRSGSGGGSATGGGMNFQYAVTAIAEIHTIRGRPLLWLEGLVEDTPVKISAETVGPGDDLNIVYKDGSSAEIQIKKGLRDSKELWETLTKLAVAIHQQEIDFGVLVVCPDTSKTISKELAKDILRLAEGRDDGLRPISKKFKKKLESLAYP